tara:strand:+ start:398 stop:577 length:180 start_codon:yes stop_codon:yes gene_type:complete
MKIGDLVKRSGWSAVKINGVVLEIVVNPGGQVTERALVMWPNKSTQWVPTHWLEKMAAA